MFLNARILQVVPGDKRLPRHVQKIVDVCGSCGVIEESPPLRGRFVPLLIRDSENRRDVLSGQSAGRALVRTRYA